MWLQLSRRPDAGASELRPKSDPAHRTATFSDDVSHDYKSSIAWIPGMLDTTSKPRQEQECNQRLLKINRNLPSRNSETLRIIRTVKKFSISNRRVCGEFL